MTSNILWFSVESLDQLSWALCWSVKPQWEDLRIAMFPLALSVLTVFRQKLGCLVKPCDAVWGLASVSGVSFPMQKKTSIVEANCLFSFVFTVRHRKRKFWYVWPSIHTQSRVWLQKCPGISLPACVRLESSWVVKFLITRGCEVSLTAFAWRGRWSFCRQRVKVRELAFLFEAAVCASPAVLAQLPRSGCRSDAV